MQSKSTRKRHRKRKRRIASDSSSSEEDSSSSSSDASTPKTAVTVPVRQSKPVTSDASDSDSDESEDSVSSSSDEPRDDLERGKEDVEVAPQRLHKPGRHPRELPLQRDSPSPEPNVDIPPFVAPDMSDSEQVLKERFRRFWMAAIAEGFKDDLEEIRKEPNLTPSRLGLLIESLASGADVFSSSTITSGSNEMEIVLDQL